MHEHAGIGIKRLHIKQRLRLELFMNHTGAAPQQHVRTGAGLNVVAEMFVRRPEDFLIACRERFDDRQRHATGDHPVRERFHSRRRICIDNHCTIRVGLTELFKGIWWAAEIQRTFGLERRHDDTLVRREDLRGFTHETNTGHNQSTGCMIPAKARHFERVRHTAAGFLGEVLHIAIDIVVGDQSCAALSQRRCDLVFQGRDAFVRQHLRNDNRNFLRREGEIW